MQHVNTVHSGEPNVNICCDIDRCVSSYKSCKGWYHHVMRVHQEIYERDVNVNDDSEEEEQEEEQEQGQVPEGNEQHEGVYGPDPR